MAPLQQGMLPRTPWSRTKERRHAQRDDARTNAAGRPAFRSDPPDAEGAGRPEPGVRRPAFLSATEFPSLNLWTSPDGAIIAAEVPGVASEDLDITIQRDTVTVRGNRPPEPVDDSTVVQRQERPHGPFARTIVLPFRVDAEKASARFERGVVTLTLPRPEDDKPHQIKVTRS